MKKPVVIFLILVFVFMVACTGRAGSNNGDANTSNPDEKMIPSYSDVRVIASLNITKNVPNEGNYKADDIMTFCFNTNTVFPENEDIASQIMEQGKNPGLGVRSLHEKGITGKGVKVAIVDLYVAQPFHEEFKDQLVQYKDMGTNCKTDEGSMHGPAVASLLVGKNCGVAPEAELYFAAVTVETKDSSYYASALRWIIEENKKLPEDDKIRVVSISAAPSGRGSPFEKNLEDYDLAVDEAKAAGILVLDCRQAETGCILPGYYDLEAPDDLTRFKTGFPNKAILSRMPDFIFAPASYRTTAEQFEADSEGYQYTGRGGLSWAIPYIAGVLALGWQVDPTLSNEEIIDILMESAYIDTNGNKIVNPTEFIKAIKER